MDITIQKVYYKLDSSLPETLDSISANNTLKDKFGLVSQEMILINKDTPNDEINEMLDKIEELDGVDFTLSYSKLSELGIPEEMLPEDLLSIFQSDKYQMILINSKYEIATDELNNQIAKNK